MYTQSHQWYDEAGCEFQSMSLNHHILRYRVSK